MPLDEGHNGFLVIRTVFFALLTYIHVLILVFALWNIVAANSSGISMPGASLFLLASSALIFVLVPTAYLAELICSSARPAHVRIECAWTAFMATFQLAASINATLNGPPTYCQVQSLWTMCTSSSLLVHISWLATLTVLSYCLTICIASSAHATYLPDIWTTPVSCVPWFRDATSIPVPSLRQPSRRRKRSPSSSSSWSDATCAISKYIAERWDKLSRIERQSVPSSPMSFSKGHQSVDTNRPDWARQHSIRRGVDSPFASPFARSLPKGSKVLPVVVAPPPRIRSRHVVPSGDSHFVEVSEQLEVTRTRSYVLSPRSPTVFPWRVGNPDLPIPCHRLSEWVRADAARRTTVHREPVSSLCQ